MIVKLPARTPINLYDVTGFDVGTVLVITNVTTNDVQLYSSETTPTVGTDNSFPCIYRGASLINDALDLGAWAICSNGGAIHVESFESSGFKPFGVNLLQNLTTGLDGTGRLKVDSQQSSFEQNTQFRFFEDVSDQTEYGGADLSVPSNKVLIYEFNAINAVNIQTRIINQWAGGRKYLVFPKDDNNLPTITGGTWADVSDQLYDINGSKNPYIDTLPITEVTVQRRVADSFVTSFKARTGTAIRTDGNSNRASSEYAPDSTRSGVAANQGFYLVFFNIGGSNDSEFLFTVGYEESF
jgi:hypothetical protein